MFKEKFRKKSWFQAVKSLKFLSIVFVLFIFINTANAEVLEVYPNNDIEFNLESGEVDNAELIVSANHFFDEGFGEFVDYEVIKRNPLIPEQTFCQFIDLIPDEIGGNDTVIQDGTGIGSLVKGVWWNPWIHEDIEDIWVVQISDIGNLEDGDYYCDLEIKVVETSETGPPVLMQNFIKTAYAQFGPPSPESHFVKIVAHIAGVVGELDGNSSIAFLPGIKASQLYDSDDTRLWIPDNNADSMLLEMNEDGTSKNLSVHTKVQAKDGLVETYKTINIYKTLIKDFDDMVSDGKIAEWKALPYDWRQSFDKVIAGGREIDGNIFYENSGGYILNSIRELAENSDSGKVSIVAHSMGGLVAKKVAQTLTDNGEDIIDRIIFVATPQLGTPLAIGSFLHGYEESIPLSLDEKTARKLAYNIEPAYFLLPSQEYTERVIDVGSGYTELVSFDDSLNNLNENNLTNLDLNFRNFYGENIFAHNELQEFLRGDEHREQPNFADTRHSFKIRADLLQRADSYHNSFDKWNAPSSIEIISIAGWGSPETVKGFKYVARSTEICEEQSAQSTCPTALTTKYYSEAEPIFTWDGDKTVVLLSAIAGGGDVYFVDLYKYRQFWQYNKNRSHKNITEIDEVRKLIENIVTEVENPSQDLAYVGTNEEDLILEPDADEFIRLAMHSPVDVHIYDEQGNHTGINAGEFEESIPGSYYIEFGESKYLGIPAGSNYRIELEGTDTGSFTFELKEMLGDTVKKSRTFTNLPTTLQTLSTITLNDLNNLNELELDLDGDGIIDEIFSADEPIIRLETQMVITQMIYGGEDILSQVSVDIGDGMTPLLLSELQENSVDLEQYTINKWILPWQEKKLQIKIKFLETAGNEYQGASVNVKFKFTATQ